MARLVFTGRVLPERTTVGISPSVEATLVTEEGSRIELTISIAWSQVSVVVVDPPADADLGTLRNRVRSAVRGLLDIKGYLDGHAYGLEIAAVVREDGTQEVFGIGIDELEASRSERPLEFSHVLHLLAESDALRRALGDIREAISSADDTGLFAYRAVETIRQDFERAGEVADRGRAWEIMRSALRIDRGWIDRIKEFGDPNRHGATRLILGDERVMVIEHARKVVDRFCVYLHRGRVGLGESDGPILSD